MKRSLLTLLVIGLAIGTIAAQFTLKPTAGINITSATKDPQSGEASGQVGYQLGASALFGNKFYGEIGVLYQRKSVEYISESDPDLNFDKISKGIRVPVQVGYHILGDRTSDVNLRGFAGASGYFVTGADGLDSDDIESPQWGVLVGAGVDFWWFFIDAKWEWSLTDVTSVTEFDIGRTHGFFLNGGVRFKF